VFECAFVASDEPPLAHHAASSPASGSGARPLAPSWTAKRDCETAESERPFHSETLSLENATTGWPHHGD